MGGSGQGGWARERKGRRAGRERDRECHSLASQRRVVVVVGRVEC